MSRCAHVNMKRHALLAFKSFPSTLLETGSYYQYWICLDLSGLPVECGDKATALSLKVGLGIRNLVVILTQPALYSLSLLHASWIFLYERDVIVMP